MWSLWYIVFVRTTCGNCRSVYRKIAIRGAVCPPDATFVDFSDQTTPRAQCPGPIGIWSWCIEHSGRNGLILKVLPIRWADVVFLDYLGRVVKWIIWYYHFYLYFFMYSYLSLYCCCVWSIQAENAEVDAWFNTAMIYICICFCISIVVAYEPSRQRTLKLMHGLILQWFIFVFVSV